MNKSLIHILFYINSKVAKAQIYYHWFKNATFKNCIIFYRPITFLYNFLKALLIIFLAVLNYLIHYKLSITKLIIVYNIYLQLFDILGSNNL